MPKIFYCSRSGLRFLKPLVLVKKFYHTAWKYRNNPRAKHSRCFLRLEVVFLTNKKLQQIRTWQFLYYLRVGWFFLKIIPITDGTLQF